MSDQSALFAILALGGFIIFLFFVLGIVLYVLASLGLYKLAINQRIENPWLAWIPIADMYILGKLIKNLSISTLEIPSIELVLPIGLVATMILNNIPVIGWLINVAYLVLCIFALYKLFKLYRPTQAILWIVLSIVLPFMGPIFLFIIRNDTPVAQ